MEKAIEMNTISFIEAGWYGTEYCIECFLNEERDNESQILPIKGISAQT